MRIFAMIAASIGLAGCMGAETGVSSSFPAVDHAAAMQSIGGRCANNPARAVSLTNHATMTAHPVRLCAGSTTLGHAVYWSGTNTEGTRLITRLTSLSGDGFAIAEQGRIEGQGNYTDTVIDFADGGRHTCRFWKPSGGIAPLRQADCTRN